MQEFRTGRRLTIYLDSPRFLAAIFLISTTLWIFQPRCHIESDPGAYSKIAFAISSGEFFSKHTYGNHIFNHRFGLTLPVAMLYKCFGVNTVTTNLWPLISALIALAAIWLAIPAGSGRFFSVLFLALNPVWVRYTAILYPDIPCTAFMTISAMLLYHRRFCVQNVRARMWYPALTVFCAFLAFETKETAVWMLPLMVGLVLWDALHRDKNLLLRFHLPALIWALVLTVGYLRLSAFIWGNPFARLHALSDVSDKHQWLLHAEPAVLLLRRLTIDGVTFLNLAAFAVFPLALSGMLFLPRRLLFFKTYGIVMILSWWFFPASVSAYEPVPLYTRFMVPVLPSICIAAGAFLATFENLDTCLKLSSRTITGLVIAASVVLSVLSSNRFHDVSPISIIVASVAGISIAGYFLFSQYSHPLPALLCAICSAGAPLFSVTPNLSERQGDAETKVVDALKEDLSSSKGTSLLFTADRRSPDLLRYFFEYHYPRTLKATFFSSAKWKTALKDRKIEHIYFFINERRARRDTSVRKEKNQVVEMLKIVRAQSQAQLIGHRDGIRLYRVR